MSGEIIPIGEEWANIKNMAGILVKSGMIPKSIDNEYKAVAIMLKGRELKIPPMQAFSKISIIQGTPTMNAELMLSLVRRDMPKAKVIYKKRDRDECIIHAARPGDEMQEFKFSMKDAQDMGLLGKDNWKKMPRQMLQWRCVTEMCRAIFPECLMGVSYTAEEINPDIRINEQGDVISDNIQVRVPREPNVLDADIEVTAPEQVSKEADTAKEAEDKKTALAAFVKKRDELVAVGWGPEDFIKKLKVSNLNELLLKDSKTIYAALEVLAE